MHAVYSRFRLQNLQIIRFDKIIYRIVQIRKLNHSLYKSRPLNPIVGHLNSIQTLMFVLILYYNLRPSLPVVTMQQLYYLETETSFPSKCVLHVSILCVSCFIMYEYLTFVCIEYLFVLNASY